MISLTGLIPCVFSLERADTAGKNVVFWGFSINLPMLRTRLTWLVEKLNGSCLKLYLKMTKWNLTEWLKSRMPSGHSGLDGVPGPVGAVGPCLPGAPGPVGQQGQMGVIGFTGNFFKSWWQESCLYPLIRLWEEPLTKRIPKKSEIPVKVINLFLHFLSKEFVGFKSQKRGKENSPDCQSEIHLVSQGSEDKRVRVVILGCRAWEPWGLRGHMEPQGLTDLQGQWGKLDSRVWEDPMGSQETQVRRFGQNCCSCSTYGYD